jgi:hypothetical protein
MVMLDNFHIALTTSQTVRGNRIIPQERSESPLMPTVATRGQLTNTTQ